MPDAGPGQCGADRAKNETTQSAPPGPVPPQLPSSAALNRARQVHSSQDLAEAGSPQRSVLARQYQTEGDDALESVFDSEEYKAFRKRVTPAEYLRTYRENSGLTQAELGEKLGVSRAYICDIEHGRRSISKEFAKELSTFFKVSVGRFII
jgi:DNA-binding XRE family transcriptional regulator